MEENRCLFCGKILVGITPCDCEKSKDKGIKLLWDKDGRRRLKKLRKESLDSGNKDLKT